MNDKDRAPFEQAKRNVARFALVESIVDKSDDVAIENSRDIREIDAVLVEVVVALGFVPFEWHGQL